MRFTRGLALVLLVSIGACTSDDDRSVPPPQPPLAAVPRLAVHQTARSPRLDGVLDEPAWRLAKTSGAFVETRNGGAAAVQASAQLLWDAKHLYVGVEVNDAWLRASDRTRDAHLWEQDCVELMLDPDGDGENYFEIQVSPRGEVFDTRYDARRVPKPFGHLDWDSQVRVGVSTLSLIHI